MHQKVAMRISGHGTVTVSACSTDHIKCEVPVKTGNQSGLLRDTMEELGIPFTVEQLVKIYIYHLCEDYIIHEQDGVADARFPQATPCEQEKQTLLCDIGNVWKYVRAQEGIYDVKDPLLVLTFTFHIWKCRAHLSSVRWCMHCLILLLQLFQDELRIHASLIISCNAHRLLGLFHWQWVVCVSVSVVVM